MRYLKLTAALAVASVAFTADRPHGFLTEVAQGDDCETSLKNEQSLPNQIPRESKALPGEITSKDGIAVQDKCGHVRIVSPPRKEAPDRPREGENKVPPEAKVRIGELKANTGLTQPDKIRIVLMKQQNAPQITELQMVVYAANKIAWTSAAPPELLKKLNASKSATMIGLDKAAAAGLARVFRDKNVLAVLTSAENGSTPLEVQITRAP